MVGQIFLQYKYIYHVSHALSGFPLPSEHNFCSSLGSGAPQAGLSQLLAILTSSSADPQSLCCPPSLGPVAACPSSSF